jgi:leucyl/phenylalanyl-tRNA---protein transferase
VNVPWLPPDARPESLPPATAALDEPNGLLAIGGNLSPEWLIYAYRHGIFPWYSRGQPILWWSPDPRCVLAPGEFRVHRSLAKSLRNGRHRITMDTAFAEVVAGCAAPRPGQDGTWITGAMARAYLELHRLGHAHCVEVWLDEGLVGGLYGVRIGAMFFGESMFSRVRDASKFALKASRARYLARIAQLTDAALQA